MYCYEAQSFAGFVQQLVRYVQSGYRFYVVGEVPARKPVEAIDAKLLQRYAIAKSSQQRARAKLRGEANLQYLRFGRTFVLMATMGRHPFFEAEVDGKGRALWRDVRRTPIRLGPYALSSRLDGQWKPGAPKRYRVHVRLAREPYLGERALLLTVSPARAASAVERLGRRFLPYAPVRKQLVRLVKALNDTRRAAGLAPVPYAALCAPRRVRAVKVFTRGEAGQPAQRTDFNSNNTPMEDT